MKNIIYILSFFIGLMCLTISTQAQINVGISATPSVVNAYYPVSSIAGNDVVVGTGTGITHSWAAGDVALLIQMTGSTLNNGGKFEFVNVTAASGSTISVDGITRDYTTSDAVQLVWVPYDEIGITIIANILAEDWNGTTGGIVALRTPGTLTMNGAILANGSGFSYADGTNTISGEDVYYGGGGGLSSIVNFDNDTGGGSGGGYGQIGIGATGGFDDGEDSNYNGGMPGVAGTSYTGGGGGGGGVGGGGAQGAGGPHGNGGGGGAGFASGGCGGVGSDGDNAAGGTGHIGGTGDTNGADGQTPVSSYTGRGGGGGGSRFYGGEGALQAVGGLSGTNAGGGSPPLSSYHQYQNCDTGGNCADPRVWMGGGAQDTIRGGGIVFIEAGNIITNSQTIAANGDTGVSFTFAQSGGGTGGGGAGIIVLNTNSLSGGTLSLCVLGGDGGMALSGDGQHGGGAGGGGGPGAVWLNYPGASTIADNSTGTEPSVPDISFCMDGGSGGGITSNPKSASFTGDGGCGGIGAVQVNPNKALFKPALCEEISCTVSNIISEICETADNGSFMVSATSTNPSIINFEYSLNYGLSWQTSGDFTGLDQGDYVVQVRDADTGAASCVSICYITIGCDNPSTVTGAGFANTNSTGGSAEANMAGAILSDGSTVGFPDVSLIYSASPGPAVLKFGETLPVGTEITLSLASWGSNTATATISYGFRTINWTPGGTGIVKHEVFTLAEAVSEITVAYTNEIVAVDGASFSYSMLVCDACTACGIYCYIDSAVNATCETAGNGSITVSANSVDPSITNFEYSIDAGATWQASQNFSGLDNTEYTIQVRDADTGDGSCVSSCTATIGCVDETTVNEAGFANTSSTGGSQTANIAGPIEALGTTNPPSSVLSYLTGANAAGTYSFDGILPVGTEVTLSFSSYNSSAAEATISYGSGNEIFWTAAGSNIIEHEVFTLVEAVSSITVTYTNYTASGQGLGLDGASYSYSITTCDACPPCTSPILTDLSNETICEGASFTAANVTTSVTNAVDVNYQWYDNNGTNNNDTAIITGQNTATLTALPSAAGSYSYRVVATNTTDGACTAEQTVDLVINANPTVGVAAAPPSICPGSSSTITATASGGDASYTYAWTFPAGETDPGNVASFSASTAGTYTVVVTDGNTCTATNNATLIPSAIPTATAASTNATCTGLSANSNGTITLSGFAATDTYQFNEGSSFNAGTLIPASPTTIPVGGVITNSLANPAADQEYTIRIFNTDGCFIDRMVTLNNTDCSCLAPTVNVTAPSVCPGDNTTIAATASGGAGGYTYAWTVPAGETDPGDNASFSAATAGMYTVTVTDGASCNAIANATLTLISVADLATTGAAICSGSAQELTTLVSDNNATNGVMAYYPTMTDAQNETNTLSSTNVSPTVMTTYFVRKNTIFGSGAVVINEVEYSSTDQVELMNLGSSDVNISNYWLCSLFSYAELNTLTIVSGDLNLSPGERVVLSGFALNDAAADLGLYNTGGSFTSAAAMEDFVQWGSASNGRESVAVTKGIWTVGDFISTVATTGNSIQYDGEGNSSADWAEASNSLGSNNSNSTTVICNDIASIVVTINPDPTATVTATSVTCAAAVANSDGMLTIAGFAATDTYQYNEGSSFNSGTATPASPTTIPVGGVITNTLVNPSGSQIYTVRIFNTDGCFVDRMVTLNENTCVSCSITAADLMVVACDDNNSIPDASDDYITFTLNPTGTDIGTGYTLTVSSGTITPTTANYGAATTFQLQNGSAGSGDVTVTITDGTESACTFDVMVTDPGSCEQSVDFPDFTQPGIPPCPISPCHVVNTDLMLGTTISADAMALSDSTATGDNDDGILFPNDLRPGINIRLQVEVTNNTGMDAYVYGWADWNDDGDFDDTGEAIIVATYTDAGVFTMSEVVHIPNTVTLTSEVGMRFRISTDQALVSGPCGTGICAPDGEVEDYLIQVVCPPEICLPVKVTINRN